MIVTKEYLKKESANFDLECIFQLDLSNKGITNLGSLSDCVNLEILNLSFNDISSLLPLKSLIHVQYVNLSCNRLSNLDGIQHLEELRSINLAGNLISSLKSLEVLTSLQHLTHLKLMDSKSGYTNPICHNVSYKQDMKKLLPNIIQLDDDNIKDNLFESYDKMVEKGANNEDINKLLSVNPIWISKDYFKDETINEENIEKLIENEFDKLSNSCVKTKQFLEENQKYLTNVIKQFHV